MRRFFTLPKSIFFISISFLFFSCSANKTEDLNQSWLADPEASRETRALLLNLKTISDNGILFGHQDDLAYGVMWKEEEGRSDVMEVSGAYPALFGWDLSKLGQRSFNIDTVDFDRMKKWIIQAYDMGGVNTISWHLDNPVSGGSSWDKTPAVYAILPGGDKHDWYKEKLDLFANFLSDLKSGPTAVPIIFRPFHEHTGNWFWWGRGNCTSEEYNALWKFTVEYLREVKDIHQLLYCYSTDRFKNREDYLEFYPGDKYVDIIAYDDYHSIKTLDTKDELIRQLREIVSIADEKGKVAALSETGYETIPDDDWWTTVFLEGLKSDSQASKIAYVMIWRNAWPHHHYVPYPGHPSAEDFIEFKKDPFTIFLDEIPSNLYEWTE